MTAKLAALLELSPDATEQDVLDRVGEWASDRRKIAASAALERRIQELISLTHMTRECALQTLQEQDARQTLVANYHQ